jgi:hypothetical protein
LGTVGRWLACSAELRNRDDHGHMEGMGVVIPVTWWVGEMARRKLSVRGLAVKSGLSRETIRSALTGKEISATSAEMMATALGRVPIDPELDRVIPRQEPAPTTAGARPTEGSTEAPGDDDGIGRATWNDAVRPGGVFWWEAMPVRSSAPNARFGRRVDARCRLVFGARPMVQPVVPGDVSGLGS